jgi:hypothetical protein
MTCSTVHKEAEGPTTHEGGGGSKVVGWPATAATSGTMRSTGSAPARGPARQASAMAAARFLNSAPLCGKSGGLFNTVLGIFHR